MSRKIILICEGPADKKLLEELIAFAGHTEAFSVKSCEGKSTFERGLRALKTGSGFDPAGIVMIRDGDTDPEAEIAAARAEFRAIGYDLDVTPPGMCIAPDGLVLGLFLFPNGNSAGALEHLLYDAAADLHPERARCVAEFERCAANSGWSENALAKMRFQCLVACCLEDNPAAPIPYLWSKGVTVVPVDSPRFTGLRAFLGSVVAAARDSQAP